ncbi:MAG TPA: hypothetical protein PK677_17055 [Acidiphilium sp.]|nr:hypothetical protein [Acidiphilium sp.]
MSRNVQRAVASLTLAGIALIILEVFADSLHIPGQLGIGSNLRLRIFMVVMAVAGMIYAGAVVLVCRAKLPPRIKWLILAAALAMRGIVLTTPPFLSTDIYRYVWDGTVQNAGINPYRYKPDAPALRSLRTSAIYPGINRKHTARTIYPPVAEAIFALVSRAEPSILMMRLAMTGFDVVAIIALLFLLRIARRPPTWILIYSWNPLPIWEISGNGHVDAIVVGFTALALLAAAARRPGWAALALAGGVLAKFLPLAMLPALWRPRVWYVPLILLGVTVGFYAHYADVGMHVFGFLGGYVHQEGIANGIGIFWLLALNRLIVLPHFIGIVYLSLAALGLICLGLRVWFAADGFDCALRARRLAADAGMLTIALMLVITPHYSWYFTWIAVPLCIEPTFAGLYLTASCFLLYLDPIHTKVLWPALVFVPTLALAVAGLRFPLRQPTQFEHQ